MKSRRLTAPLEGCIDHLSPQCGRRGTARWMILACCVLAASDCPVVQSPLQAAEEQSPVLLEQRSQPRVAANVVEDFALTERSGKTIGRADLLGRPWLACFIFTRCISSCPRVTGQMAQLQSALRNTDVQLVTFTVDPDYDTVERLAAYADRAGADRDRWWFLTGDQQQIFHLIHHSFRMPVQEKLGEDRRPGFEVIHSNNIMHVDAQGIVVGKYDSGNDGHMAGLRRVLRQKTETPQENRFIDPRQAVAVATTHPPDKELRIPSEQQREEPAWVVRLPALNATLNATSTLLLLVGYGLIRTGKRVAHMRVMLLAFGTSMLFLGCYLVYHYWTGSKPFAGTGVIRAIYYAILITHVLLAASVPVLALITISRGLNEQWPQHRKIARITFPIWLYVSVTGVIIYFLLYHWPN